MSTHSRKTKVWHVWESSDMAISDQFLPNKTAMLKYVKETYGAKGPGRSDLGSDLTWEIPEAEDPTRKYIVHANEVEIETTKVGICEALTNLPNR